MAVAGDFEILFILADGFGLTDDGAGHQIIGEARAGDEDRRVPAEAKGRAVLTNAQIIGRTRRDADRFAGEADDAGGGEGFEKAALARGGPAIGAGFGRRGEGGKWYDMNARASGCGFAARVGRKGGCRKEQNGNEAAFVSWPELDPGLRRGAGVLGILLAGMDEEQHFYSVSSDGTDQDVIGMDDDVTRAERAAGSVRVGIQR